VERCGGGAMDGEEVWEACGGVSGDHCHGLWRTRTHRVLFDYTTPSLLSLRLCVWLGLLNEVWILHSLYILLFSIFFTAVKGGMRIDASRFLLEWNFMLGPGSCLYFQYFFKIFLVLKNIKLIFF
jgi:hypothetical protein